MSRGRASFWVAAIILGAILSVTFFTLQVPILSNKIIDWGIESVVEDTMPSAVHIQYRSGSVDEWGRETAWQGSGVIISKDGLILTARHVCEKPGIFTVTLVDGRIFETTKACVSKNHDVGYLKVDVIDPNLPAAKFGDSDDIKLGGRLLAIGSPWGKEHFNSVTMGILSACNLDKSEGIPSWGWGVLFQTDLAANPGNSGGPVFNIEGEVVGIVVGLFGPGSYAGITYCVPSNICESFVKSARLVFALQEVAYVETDRRLDDLEAWRREVSSTLYDIKWRLDSIESGVAPLLPKTDYYDYQYDNEFYE